MSCEACGKCRNRNREIKQDNNNTTRFLLGVLAVLLLFMVFFVVTTSLVTVKLVQEERNQEFIVPGSFKAVAVLGYKGFHMEYRYQTMSNEKPIGKIIEFGDSVWRQTQYGSKKDYIADVYWKEVYDSPIKWEPVRKFLFWINDFWQRKGDLIGKDWVLAGEYRSTGSDGWTYMGYSVHVSSDFDSVHGIDPPKN